MSRASNSMRNIVFGLGGQMLNIIMSFLMRTVFVATLGESYLGVNGLFTNILMVFSLADLGVGTAIIFALYKPVAQQDTRRIQALMNLYGKAYRICGLAIIALGLAMLPFLDVFVNTKTDIPHLGVIFMLFVLNTASTYFFAYKGTLITAHQKNYIVTNVIYISSVVCYGVQIAVMLLTHNYILTLSIQVGTNILQNIITMIIANRMYPYIRGRNNVQLEKAEKRKIFSNMGSLMFYRVGQVVINGTDNIVISAMVGTEILGVYTNYLLLTTTIKNLLQQVFKAVTASVGNLNAVETDEKKYSAFNVLFFGNFWMFGFAAACFWVLFNPFVELWLGSRMLMDIDVVFLIVLDFYLVGMRNVNITFRDTMGVFRQGRFVPLVAAVANVVISIALAPSLGIAGVFIGTAVSTAGTLLWMEPVILFRHGFRRSVTPYFARYWVYFVMTMAMAAITGLAASIFTVNNIWTFLGRMAICLVIPNAMIVAVFSRTQEYKTLVGMVKGYIGRRLRRRGAAA